MLTLYSEGKGYPIQNDDYYIREIPGGLNEVIFTISIWDELYAKIVEEANIKEGEGQMYLVKQIDGGANDAKVVCQLDLDEWRAEMLISYSNNSATVNDTITGVLPSGWTLQDRALLNIRRTIEGDYTPLEIVQTCIDTYGVQVQFDNKNKIITIFFAENEEPLGAFATRELNLKEINYKGKSTDFATRLYPYGKDGLSFASINDGKPYVDNNTYSSRVICAYWKDERYEVAENLLADAKTTLAAMAVPQRSYACSVIDLASPNPEMYSFQDFSIFRVITLVDDAKKTRINHQVVEVWRYPYYPEKNKVVLSTVVPKIQSQIKQVQQQIDNPNSSFRQQQQIAIDNATNWLTSSDGYVVAVKDDSGTWKELLFLDTADTATAKNVLRINTNGIGFSTNGVNGPYTNAWTIDGNLVADFITSGTINANLVRIINLIVDHLISNNGTYSMEGWAASMLWKDGANYRARTYVTDNSEGNSIGLFQVFSGSTDEEGNLQEGALLSQLQPNYLEVGSDGKGNFSGQIKAGTIDTDQGASIGGGMSVNELLSAKGGAEIGGYADINGPLFLNSAQIRPGPNQNLLTVDWIRVPTSDGGTCWALASRA